MKLFGRTTKESKKSVSTVKVTDKVIVAEEKSETSSVKANLILARQSILVKPLVSEKATMVNALNKYIFVVSPKANKSEIKKAIKELYGVTPIAVNVINKLGKFTYLRGRQGRTKDFKKAIITLKKGDSIKIYEGI